MSVFFHVGYPKTATTWFQKNLFPLIRKMKYIDRQMTNSLFVKTNAFTFNPLDIKSKINYRKSDLVLFSSEGIVTSINIGRHSGALSKLSADKIKATFPNAKIILFIRNQKCLVASAYQQYVRNGGTYGFKRYLYSEEVLTKDHLCFDKLIEYYDLLFGKNNVFVFLFEDFKRNPQLFVESMCSDMGFEIDLNSVDYWVVNKGLRKRMLKLIRLLNMFHRHAMKQKRYFFHIPFLVGFINRYILPLNRYNIFGDYITYETLIEEKDIQHLDDVYTRSNQLLKNRVNEKRLLKNGYTYE